MNKRVFFLLLVLIACAAQSMAQSMVWGINTREPENSIIRDCPDRAASVMYKQSYDSCRFYYVKYGSSSCISAEFPSEYRVNDMVYDNSRIYFVGNDGNGHGMLGYFDVEEFFMRSGAYHYILIDNMRFSLSNILKLDLYHVSTTDPDSVHMAFVGTYQHDGYEIGTVGEAFLLPGSSRWMVFCHQNDHQEGDYQDVAVTKEYVVSVGRASDDRYFFIQAWRKGGHYSSYLPNLMYQRQWRPEGDAPDHFLITPVTENLVAISFGCRNGLIVGGLFVGRFDITSSGILNSYMCMIDSVVYGYPSDMAYNAVMNKVLIADNKAYLDIVDNLHPSGTMLRRVYLKTHSVDNRNGVGYQVCGNPNGQFGLAYDTHLTPHPCADDATPNVIPSRLTPGERSVLMSIAEDRVDERVGYVECKENPLYIVCEE